MIDLIFFLLFFAVLLVPIGIIMLIVLHREFGWNKYILPISVASFLSLLMTIAMEIEAYLNPDIETGIGLFLLLIFVIGWFFLFIGMSIGTGIGGLATGEDDLALLSATIWVPSVIVSIVDAIIIVGCISSPWFPIIL